MKKIISLLTLLFLVVSRIFAGEYIYWDDHKTSSSGKTTAHVRICYSKEYNNNSAANERLRHVMYDIFLKDGDYPVTHNVTEVHLSNGVEYRILFSFYQDRSGVVKVLKGNERSAYGTPMETIYENYGSYWFTYNSFYEIYQQQCNKYLNML